MSARDDQARRLDEMAGRDDVGILPPTPLPILTAFEETAVDASDRRWGMRAFTPAEQARRRLALSIAAGVSVTHLDSDRIVAVADALDAYLDDYFSRREARSHD